MIRCRFNCDNEDYRPVKWPIKYPYWCSGISDDGWILIAYANFEDEIYELWPEASNLDIEEVEEIIFTSRFPKPKWYDTNKA